jgi:hypothetical protein
MRTARNVIAVVAGSTLFGAIGAFVTLWLKGRISGVVSVPTFAALLGAVVAPYVAEWLRMHWFIAAFDVRVEGRPPWHVPIQVEVVGGDPVAAVRANVAHYYRLSVLNVGLAQAKDCEAVLHDVWFHHSEAWWHLGYWQPDNFHWAGDNRQLAERTINRGREVFFDVGFIPAAELLGRLPVVAGWPGAAGPVFRFATLTQYLSQPGELGQGRYVLGVTVYASNARPQTVFLALRFEQDNFDRIVDAGVMGTAVPGVEVTIASNSPAEFGQVSSPLDILRIQSSGP